ncbi:MAG: mechanosensitive ion channel family protein [Pseudomonadota bacterium]
MNHKRLASVILAALLGLMASVGSSLASTVLAPADTSSPRATYTAYWQEMSALEDAWARYKANKSAAGIQELARIGRRLVSMLDTSELPPATRFEAASAAALEIFDILVRLPRVEEAAVPGEGEDTPQKWRLPLTELTIERIAEGPRAGEYLFSADTVGRVDAFHRAIINEPLIHETRYPSWRDEIIHLTGPAIPDAFVAALPNAFNATLFGTPIWKVVVIVLLFGVVIVLTVLWAAVVARLRRTCNTAWGLSLRLTVPGLLALLVALIGSFYPLQINPAGGFAEASHIMRSVLGYFAVAWSIWLLCFFIVEAIIAAPSIPDDSYDAHLLRLVARVAAFLFAGGIIVYGASDVGIPALGLLAGVGVGGFALALAAQSTVENLFGGVSIFADRPFRVGDFIRYGSDLGVVEAIGPRSTRLRGLDNTLTTVPNADLAKIHVTNISKRSKCLFVHVIGVRYETSRAQIEWLVEELRDRLTAHEMVEEASGLPRVRLVGFGSSSIDIEVRAYVLTSDYGEFLRVQEELMLMVMRAVEAAGTGFAFPSQTAYLARDSGLDEDAKQRVERQMRRRGRRAPDEADHTGTPEEEEAVDVEEGVLQTP